MSVQKINYFLMAQDVIKKFCGNGKKPSLLLHCCCAPCASHCLVYLSQFFKVTAYFFNPNIFTEEEYQKRLNELKRLVCELKIPSIDVVTEPYMPQAFFDVAKDFADAKEGGERCKRCFELRINQTAQVAQKNGFDFFSTTLTISPLKDEQLLNKIGVCAAQTYGSQWFFSDFKKQGGFLQSTLLSKQYNLYRQNYCGCIYSKQKTDN